MSYGLYLSAAGALTSMHRQNVYANNLANIRTNGFKPDAVDIRARHPERIEDPQALAEPKWMLEQLGGGVYAQPTRVSLDQGQLMKTGNNLDLALAGEGFFVVSDGPGGPETHRLTRDGRFTVNASGDLVTAAGGLRVLDANNQPIRIDTGQTVQIDERGGLVQGGSPVAQLRIVGAPASDQIVKAGHGLLRTLDPATAPVRFDGAVRQGYTEASAVDPILTMNSMMNAAKAAQGNLRLMQYHDQLLGRAFNTFGRVA